MNIVELLISKNLSLSTAESFTGGMLASSIVNLSSASKCFNGGVVSYTKEAKNKLLGISLKDIEENSVYSSFTARKMCDGIMAITQSSISIGTTGVAGPGSDEGVSAGTLFYTIKINNEYFDRCIKLNFDRNQNRIEAVKIIINDLTNLVNNL